MAEKSNLPGKRRFRAAALAAAMLALNLSSAMTQTSSSTPQRDINAVLADNDKRLLAIEGVVGVYVGLLDDEKTECLKLMLSRPRNATDPVLPRSLEGYSVLTEVTGNVRPQ